MFDDKIIEYVNGQSPLPAGRPCAVVAADLNGIRVSVPRSALYNINSAHAARQMREGPSGSACRSGPQTAKNCCGKGPWWRAFWSTISERNSYRVWIGGDERN